MKCWPYEVMGCEPKRILATGALTFHAAGNAVITVMALGDENKNSQTATVNVAVSARPASATSSYFVSIASAKNGTVTAFSRIRIF